MNHLSKNTHSSHKDAEPSKRVLHTDDVREDIRQFINKQKDTLSNIKENLDFQTDDHIEVLNKTALQSRYKLITQNVGTVKESVTALRTSQGCVV